MNLLDNRREREELQQQYARKQREDASCAHDWRTDVCLLNACRYFAATILPALMSAMSLAWHKPNQPTKKTQKKQHEKWAIMKNNNNKGDLRRG